MKNISELIKRLDPESVKELSALIKLKTAKEKDILKSILTSTGIHFLLSGLDHNELIIFNTLYSGNDGISFRDVEKNTGLKLEEIDDASNRLMNKLLVYRIKNRQLLTNKMDKLYSIKEISGIINLSSKDIISHHLKKLKSRLETREKKESPVTLNSRERALLKKIISTGYLLSLENAEELSGKSFNRLIGSLHEKKVIRIFHNINREYSAYLSIDENYIQRVFSQPDSGSKPPETAVNNRYFFLLNILNVFDTVSTFGLFLTKQGKFRKIDKKRIADSLFRLKTPRGADIPQSEMSQLTMHLMSRLHCLRMDKDIAVTTLRGLSDEIKNPVKFTVKILHSLKKNHTAEDHFPQPFFLPGYRDIRRILCAIHALGETEPSRLFAIALLEILSEETAKDLTKSVSDLGRVEMRVEGAINFLCILGIIETDGNRLKITAAGLKVAAALLGIKQKEQKAEKQRSIYINPDFTLIIPAEEMDSAALYFLLVYTDIVKYDFILHAVLSKNSIVKALKRGFDTGKFIEVLNSYSKNDIPQNLNFLLNEWSNQTIMLGINRAIVMKTSHPSFIEDILHSKLKNCIIERISPNHAIIDINSIDDIIKFARKSDAVISLFGE
jgi:hypothetical protein